MNAISRSIGVVVLAAFSLGTGVPRALAYSGWGTALSFAGGDDHVAVPGVAAFPATAFTVEFWMRSADTSRAGTLFSYCVSAGDNALVIGDCRDIQIVVNNVSATSGVSANDGRWHHLAVTWHSANGELEVYRDGALVFSRSGVATGTAIPAGGTVVLGQRPTQPGGGFEPGDAFAGDLDEVRVWSVARSAEAIQSTMWRPLRGDEAGLAAHWSLDEGSGTVAHDSTAGAFDGTLFNEPAWVTYTAPLRLLYFTEVQQNDPQNWTFRFHDAGTGSTNYALEFVPDLSSGQVWTDLTETEVTSTGDGTFQADVTPAAGQRGFYRLRGERSVRVNFSSTGLELEEGAGTDHVTLVFDRPFVGTVNYSVGGPDTDSIETLTGSVAVHGTRAHIPIVLRDDVDIGTLKHFTLSLQGGLGYEVGAVGRQTVIIEDNDAEWQGHLFIHSGLWTETTTLVGGTEVTVPLNTRATIDFVLKIQQSAAGTQAALKSEDYGFFPADEVPAQIQWTANNFDVRVPNIPLETGGTRLDAPMTLVLDLTAQNGLSDQLVSGQLIQGQAALVQRVTGQPHLDTTSTGTFELRKPAARPSTHQVDLVP